LEINKGKKKRDTERERIEFLLDEDRSISLQDLVMGGRKRERGGRKWSG